MFFRGVSGLTALAIVAAGLVSIEMAAASPAEAATSQFRPGHIISDEIFFDSDAMSVQEIQNFLDARVPVCSRNAACLKDHRQQTANRASDPMCRGYTGRPDESAAEIIHNVARSCGVNPQVILVTLQKEQRLVTSTAPSDWAWTASMGYACPDTAACDSQYYGFFNQVYAGTRQLVRYGNPPGTSQYFTWFPVGAYSNVRFHPNASCGSSRVLIENRATAALYYYTPYQPTPAALAAGYAAAPGDPCASYGNRNFFNFFTDWFGPTYSESRVAIDAAYARFGSTLGQPVSDYNYLPDNGGGTVRAYQNGAITWTETLGAHVVTGDFRAEYSARGGTAGSLGWPASSANAVAGNGDGRVQGFQNGALAKSASGSFHVISGSVRAALASAGGVSGPIGWPTSEVACTGSTCQQSFQNGRILATPSTTRFEVPAVESYLAARNLTRSAPSSLNLSGSGGFVTSVSDGSVVVWTRASGALRIAGPERAALARTGGLSGFLGWPSSENICDQWCLQHFDGGVIAESDRGEPIPVRQSMWDASLTNASPQQPTGAENPVKTPFGEGLVQAFSDAAVTSHPTAGTFRIGGELRAAYAVRGGLTGSLGWPASTPSVIDARGARGSVQGFQSGALVVRGGEHVVVSGAIRTRFQSAGGINGGLGWPIDDAREAMVDGVRGSWQHFQTGAIFAPSNGPAARLVAGETWSPYGSPGQLLASLGWATGESTSLASSFSTSGIVQGFDRGAVVSTAAYGTYSITGRMRSLYGERGGVTGPLGWPIAAQTCSNDLETCTQRFEGGQLSAPR